MPATHTRMRVGTAQGITGSNTNAANQNHLLTGGFDLPQNIRNLPNQHASWRLCPGQLTEAYQEHPTNTAVGL